MQIMGKFRTKYLVILAIVCTVMLHPVSVMAQAAATGDSANSILLEDSLADAYTVMGTTAAGAVLGLSTLSFVENPSDHLKRVVVAGAVGLIIGVAVIAFKTANTSSNMYLEGVQTYIPKTFSTGERVAWHQVEHAQLNASKLTSQVGYQFSF